MALATLIEQRPKAKTKRTHFTTPPQEKLFRCPQTSGSASQKKPMRCMSNEDAVKGHALDDWLDAEYLVNNELYEIH